MACEHILEQLLRENRLTSTLRQGSSDHEEIKALQLLLYELGYGRQLRWRKRRADGLYEKQVTRAVRRFTKRNNLVSDGTVITDKMAQAMLYLYDLLDEMQQLYRDVKVGNMEEDYRTSSDKTVQIAALQTLLNAAGYGEQLKWEVYGADGDYGVCTIEAVRALASAFGMRSDGKALTKKLAKQLLKQFSGYYGKDWPRTRKTVDLTVDGTEDFSKEVKPIGKAKSASSLVIFSSSRFIGKKIICDQAFIPALKKIHEYAEQNDIKVYVTSSFRTDVEIPEAIVPPAFMSNHRVGHAIDMNVRYGEGYQQWCTFKELVRSPLPQGVEGFINAIRKDPSLRWGGDFGEPDPVHIDDHFNQDPIAWQKKFTEVQHERELGLG